MLHPFYCTQLTIEHSGKLPWSPKMMISKKIPVASAFMPVFSDPKANLESRVRAVLDLVDSKREGMQ